MTTGSLIDAAGCAADASDNLGGGLVLGTLRDGEIAGLATAMAALEPWRALGYQPAALAHYWQRPDVGACRIEVRLNARCAGALCVRPRWLCGPFLELLCLLPQAQGQGVGRRIIDWLATRAAGLGANLWTSVSSTNPRAHAFYRRNGFVEAARLPQLIATDADELLLRRHLGNHRPGVEDHP
ncbi:N-acetyltransferase [uncultured Thiohalocapsa sp.]|uniref:GNAT family N-acetyltransferase n=1 Tax=uncultured Thiohalocapsa sp. TaxID=768990 RepID=UPI0025FA44BC|nr:GNAT family N-acetyltransferase [uncultured Thiohalocapsa sp.]